MMSTRTSNFPALYSLDAHARVHTQPRDNKNDRSNKVFIGLLIFVAAAATKRTRFAFETIPTIPLIIVPFAPVSPHEGLMLFIPKSVKKKKKKRLAHKRHCSHKYEHPYAPYIDTRCTTIRHGLAGLVSVGGRVKSETRIERAGVRK